MDRLPTEALISSTYPLSVDCLNHLGSCTHTVAINSPVFDPVSVGQHRVYSRGLKSACRLLIPQNNPLVPSHVVICLKIIKCYAILFYSCPVCCPSLFGIPPYGRSAPFSGPDAGGWSWALFRTFISGDASDFRTVNNATWWQAKLLDSLYFMFVCMT